MRKLLLVLLGKRGAGKTSFAISLKCGKNFTHYEMSSIMKSIQNKMGFHDLKLRIFVSRMHKQKSKDFGIRFMFQNNFFRDENVVITGIRNIEEINFLFENLSQHRIIIIYLDPGFLIRLKRILFRNERNSIIQFLIEEYYSFKWGDRLLRRRAIPFSNRGTLIEEIERFYNTVVQPQSED